jgi:hypothetical protein
MLSRVVLQEAEHPFPPLFFWFRSSRARIEVEHPHGGVDDGGETHAHAGGVPVWISWSRS